MAGEIPEKMAAQRAGNRAREQEWQMLRNPRVEVGVERRWAPRHEGKAPPVQTNRM
jgi:hypothetical protein